MAKFIFEKIKYGYDGKPYQYFLSLKSIEFEENDETVYIPAEYQGEPVAFLGFQQAYEHGGERWHDWHHPSQGCEYIKPHYGYKSTRVNVPPHVKKIVLPATAQGVPSTFFVKHSDLVYEVDENNPVLTVEDNRIVRKDGLNVYGLSFEFSI